MEPVVALVVAAGSGSRLGGDIPKALRELDGRPLVSHSLEGLAAGGVDRAVIVIAPGLDGDFAGVVAGSPIPARCVHGGAERQDSVLNGLAAIAADPDLSHARYVLVHDAARALVPADVVRRVIEALVGGAVAAIPVLPVVDTIREVTPTGSATVDRSRLRAVQTPQGFARDVLEQAHRLVADQGLQVTDDAAAVEALGHPVVLVPGDREALKVTEPLDLLFAEAIVRSHA
ncbi:MAG TPA: 2-C-methyl-D-erythritol 4-phosphate cytidylyltransferase [Propionicimonas sp.]|jgi:2-C-methyl-D-erythritol 4-phosphate cytidylyltransferase